MNKLTVFNFNNEAVLDSREVAEMVGKRHDHLIRDIAGYIKIMEENGVPKNGESSTELKVEPSDFFIKHSYVNSQNKEQPCYLITKKGCDMVANKMTGEKGVLFTAVYVAAFERMKLQLAHPQLPQDFAAALRMLADSTEKTIALEAKIEEDRPKVLFADAVSASHTSILVGELAKLLKQNGVDIGQERLFNWLRANGYLIKRKGADRNMPTQKSMELGLFEIKETVVSHSTHTSVKKTPKVTGKGQQYFVNKFLGDSSLLPKGNAV